MREKVAENTLKNHLGMQVKPWFLQYCVLTSEHFTVMQG